MPAVTDADIALLVDSFYARVRTHPVLSPVFHGAIGDTEQEWDAHLDKLRRFWSAVMLRSGTYHGDPFTTHLRLPNLTPQMFDDWLSLFDATCTEIFTPAIAAAFHERAHRIGRSLQIGLFERLPRMSSTRM